MEDMFEFDDLRDFCCGFFFWVCDVILCFVKLLICELLCEMRSGNERKAKGICTRRGSDRSTKKLFSAQ